MTVIVKDKTKVEMFLIGNEAVARSVIKAGVGVVTAGELSFPDSV